MTLLFAGHETTASALAWALYWLHRSPDVAREKLCRELETQAALIDPIEISPAALPCCGLPGDPASEPTVHERAAGPEGATDARPLRVRRRNDPHHLDLSDSSARRSVSATRCTSNRRRFLGRKFSLYEYLPFGGGHRVCLGNVAGALRNEAGASDDPVALAPCACRSWCSEPWTPRADRGPRREHAVDPSFGERTPRGEASPPGPVPHVARGLHDRSCLREVKTRHAPARFAADSSPSSCRPAIAGDRITKAIQTLLLNDYHQFQMIVVDQSDEGHDRRGLEPVPRCVLICVYVPYHDTAVRQERGMPASTWPRARFIGLLDDDCEVPRNWVRELAEAFADRSANRHRLRQRSSPARTIRTDGFVPAYIRHEPFLGEDDSRKASGRRDVGLHGHTSKCVAGT